MEQEEEFRSLAFLGFPGYEISSIGRVKSLLSKQIIGGHINCEGYIVYGLISSSEKVKVKKGHQLVAEAFLADSKTEILNTVDHRNRERSDNRVENLRWASYKMQRANQRPRDKVAGRPVYQIDKEGNIVALFETITEAAAYLDCFSEEVIRSCKLGHYCRDYFFEYADSEDIPGEEWKPFTHKGRELKASSFGRIEFESGRRTFGSRNDDGYMVTDRSARVHRLVVEAFMGPIPEGMVVNHKNLIKCDNRLGNLEIVTRRENNIHAAKSGGVKRCKPVIQFTRSRIEINRFHSINEAARCTDVDVRSISAVCHGKQEIAGGYRWCFVKPEDAQR